MKLLPDKIKPSELELFPGIYAGFITKYITN
jgi:hypothetical protein